MTINVARSPEEAERQARGEAAEHEDEGDDPGAAGRVGEGQLAIHNLLPQIGQLLFRRLPVRFVAGGRLDQDATGPDPRAVEFGAVFVKVGLQFFEGHGPVQVDLPGQGQGEFVAQGLLRIAQFG